MVEVGEAQLAWINKRSEGLSEQALKQALKVPGSRQNEVLTMKKITLAVIAVVISMLFITVNTQADEEKTAMTKSMPVILINPVTVPEEKLDEAIKAREAGRDFLAQQPGYISTKLHQSLSPDAQYLLINVAEWETPEDFQAAIAAMRVKAEFPPVKGVVPAPALYKVIRN